MNYIFLYARNFAYSHEYTLYSNNAALLKALSQIFRRYCWTLKSLFLADRRAEGDRMSETGVSSCEKYRGEWLKSELCLSKHNLHCILTVTGSQWSSRSAEDVISMYCHLKDSLQRH